MSTPAATPSASGSKLISFSESYSQRLAKFTTTDKSQISSLTILADENKDKVKEVVGCIENSLRDRPTGDERLPLLYLIDSLCQNLGPKKVPFPKLFDPIITKIMQSTVKRASKRVQGSLYRMWNQWRLKKVFHDHVIKSVEDVLTPYLDEDERKSALDRSSTANVPGDPRKRPAPESSVQQPVAKKPVTRDPRLPTPSPPPPPPSQELQQLLTILGSPDIASRVDLQPLVQQIRRDISQPLPPARMKEVTERAARALMNALAAGRSLPPMQPTFIPPVTILPPPIGGLPMLPPLPPVFPRPIIQPLIQPVSQPLHQLPLHAPPPMNAWPVDPITAANRINQSSTMPPLMIHEELAHPITFSELDLKTPHPWVVESIYSRFPIKCKTCGRRIHNEGMGAHMDEHRRLKTREQIIEKSGSQSQKWYWEEWEWIQAEDVIFGVQDRLPAKGAKGMDGKKSDEPSNPLLRPQVDLSNLELMKETYREVKEDDEHPCSLCQLRFEHKFYNAKEDLGEDENWMYRDCLRMPQEFLQIAQTELSRLEALAPTSQNDFPVGSAQAIAAASKEEDRLTQIYRYRKIVEHVQEHLGKLIHATCHYLTVQSILKQNRPVTVPVASTVAIRPGPRLSPQPRMDAEDTIMTDATGSSIPPRPIPSMNVMKEDEPPMLEEY